MQQLRDQVSQQEEAINVSTVYHQMSCDHAVLVCVQAEEMGLQKLHQQLKDIQQEEQQLKTQVS